MTFNMCTQTTGVDCSAVGFAALAVQSGSFGCAIVANWQPVATPAAVGCDHERRATVGAERRQLP